MKQFKLDIQSRQETGRGPAYRLRKVGRIPAVLYGKSGSHPISVSTVDFRTLSKEASGSAALIELKDEKGKVHLALVQDVERNPITDQFNHIDFHEVGKNEVFNAHVPLHIIGEEACIGVRNENGLVEQHVYELGVRCKPADLPEHVDVDVTTLSLGQGIHLSDLKPVKGVEFIGDPEIMLVACTGTKAGRIAAGIADDDDGIVAGDSEKESAAVEA